VLGGDAVGRFLRADDVRQPGDRNEEAAQVVLHDLPAQIRVAGRPGRHEADIEVTERRREVDQLDVPKERCITGERHAVRYPLCANARAHLSERGGQALEVLALTGRADVGIARAEGRAVQCRRQTA
jgi:hypothetical protein